MRINRRKMKESNLRKLVISGAIALPAIGAGAKYSAHINNNTAEIPSKNNVKIEQTESPFENTNFTSSINKAPSFSSSIMDEFEEATESLDESDIKEKGIETLIEESKQAI